MPHTRKNAGEKVVALRSDVDTLRDDIVKLTSTLETLLGHQIDRAQHSAHDLTERISDEFSTAKNWVETRVQERPAQSCAVALGVGVLAGVLLTRRG